MIMVEVFRTTVTDRDLAAELIRKIENTFDSYSAHFDLDDCDKILRISTPSGKVEAPLLISLLKNAGVQAEVLPDEIPTHAFLKNLN
jgi:hypothetical protein